jgi:hypothetical protein
MFLPAWAVALAKALLFAANALVASSRSRVLAKNTLKDVEDFILVIPETER